MNRALLDNTYRCLVSAKLDLTKAARTNHALMLDEDFSMGLAQVIVATNYLKQELTQMAMQEEAAKQAAEKAAKEDAEKEKQLEMDLEVEAKPEPKTECASEDSPQANFEIE